MMCDAPTCPRGCGLLSRWRGFQAMFQCPACNAAWRHVQRGGGCGLIGTVAVGVGKETLTSCEQAKAKQMDLF